MAITTFPMILKEVRSLTPNTRHFVFHREEGALEFIPGQFVSIHFEHEGKELRRSYSLATIPGVSTEIEFAASYFKGGPASELLFHLKEGTVLQCSGPYGRLILREEKPARYFLVATGTGVTPYRAMLPSLKKRLEENPSLKVIVLLGVRDRNDALYLEDFLSFEKETPGFQFFIHYSREKDTTLAPYERHGYVQTAFQEWDPKPAEDIFYLCGNPNMIDDSYALLKEKGFTPHSVRREKYVS